MTKKIEWTAELDWLANGGSYLFAACQTVRGVVPCRIAKQPGIEREAGLGHGRE
jgi:hypothetical protein